MPDVLVVVVSRIIVCMLLSMVIMIDSDNYNNTNYSP